MPVFAAADITVRVNTGQTYEPVCDIETMEARMSYQLERRIPADDGWGRCLVAGRWLELSFKGKRCDGSPGNDYIAGRALAAVSADEKLELVFPNGEVLRVSGAVCVVVPFGGPGLCALEWRFVSSGPPARSVVGEG